MQRKIIEIDETKCKGCGLCAAACHEGAIGIVGGKARLIRDDYCDGLGNCLPVCPTGAIAFTERETAPFRAAPPAKRAASRMLESDTQPPQARSSKNFPIQIKLTSPRSPAFDGGIVVAADCCGFLSDGLAARTRGKALLIGCPKLDEVDYSEKLAVIFSNNAVSEVTVLRMSVPCCGALARMVTEAAEKSGKEIPIDIQITDAR
jgi:NAD-dependent dihydropyrimidine dehydrogenase PreA subunit